jgi:hypothetical protein
MTVNVMLLTYDGFYSESSTVPSYVLDLFRDVLADAELFRSRQFMEGFLRELMDIDLVLNHESAQSKQCAQARKGELVGKLLV